MKHNFSPIRNPLEKILKQYKLYDNYEIDLIFNNWSEIVGTNLSKISKPVSYDDKKQIVRVKINSESWKKEFIKEKQKLLDQLNSYTKALKIKDISFE